MVVYQRRGIQMKSVQSATAASDGAHSFVPEISQPNLDLLGRAQSLYSLIHEHAPDSDRDRRVSEVVIDALEELDLFQVCTPRRYGGFQSNFRTLFELTAEIARGDGGTAWAFALLNSNAWGVGTYSREAQDDIWGANPRARITWATNPAAGPTASARKVDGGYVISGRWPYASGSLHAQWVNLGFDVEIDGAPVRMMSLVPMDEVTLEDTWYVAGMRGSGSNTVVGTEVFAPDYRTQSFDNLNEGNYASEFTDELEYLTPMAPHFSLVLVGAQIGLAQAALDYALEKLPTRGVTYTKYAKGSDAPTNQIAVAEAANAIDTARMLGRRACYDIDAAVVTNRGQIDWATRARIRMDLATIAVLCRESIDKMLTAIGSAAFASVNPLQQVWRDSETASRHAMVNEGVSKETYGKSLLGIDEFVMPI